MEIKTGENMTDTATITMVESIWKMNRLGAGMFIIGTILCMTGAILSIIWKLAFAPPSEKVAYVFAMIGIGVSFILTGINILLQSQKLSICRMSKGTYGNYVKDNKILIVELLASVLLIMLISVSYPDGWNYPKLYVLFIPYVACTSLLVLAIFSNINCKEENELKEIE